MFTSSLRSLLLLCTFFFLAWPGASAFAQQAPPPPDELESSPGPNVDPAIEEDLGTLGDEDQDFVPVPEKEDVQGDEDLNDVDDDVERRSDDDDDGYEDDGYEDDGYEDDRPPKPVKAKPVDKMVPAIVAGGAACVAGVGLVGSGAICGPVCLTCTGPVTAAALGSGGVLVGALIADIPFDEALMPILIAAGGPAATTFLLGGLSFAVAIGLTAALQLQGVDAQLMGSAVAGIIGIPAGIATIGIVLASVFLFMPDEVGGSASTQGAQVVQAPVENPAPIWSAAKQSESSPTESSPTMAF